MTTGTSKGKNGEPRMSDLRMLLAAHESMGIYPMAVVEADGTRKDRTEWQNGWNEALCALTAKWETFSQWWAKLPKAVQSALGELLDAEAVSLQAAAETVTFYAICNDTFGWATADAEDVTMDDVPLIHELWKAHGHDGVVAWIEAKRGEKAYEFSGAEAYKDKPELVAARATLALRSLPGNPSLVEEKNV